MAAKQQGMIEHGRSRRAAPAAQQLPVRHAPNRHGRMSGAYQPATTFDEEMPVRCLGALVAELKACILERLEPGQDWAGFAVHLTARGVGALSLTGRFAANGTAGPSARRSTN
jgi:hypothetical protein